MYIYCRVPVITFRKITTGCRFRFMTSHLWGTSIRMMICLVWHNISMPLCVSVIASVRRSTIATPTPTSTARPFHSTTTATAMKSTILVVSVPMSVTIPIRVSISSSVVVVTGSWSLSSSILVYFVLFMIHYPYNFALYIVVVDAAGVVVFVIVAVVIVVVAGCVWIGDGSAEGGIIHNNDTTFNSTDIRTWVCDGVCDGKWWFFSRILTYIWPLLISFVHSTHSDQFICSGSTNKPYSPLATTHTT